MSSILQEGGFVTVRMFSPQDTGEQQTMEGEALGRPKPDARFMHAVFKPKQHHFALPALGKIDRTESNLTD